MTRLCINRQIEHADGVYERNYKELEGGNTELSNQLDHLLEVNERKAKAACEFAKRTGSKEKICILITGWDQEREVYSKSFEYLDGETRYEV